MLSLVELSRVSEALRTCCVGGRVERFVEPGPGRLAFSLYRRDGDDKQKWFLELDARPELAHVALHPRLPKAPERLPAFCAYLRAHLSRAKLEGASLRGDDRQLALRFSGREGERTLLHSHCGRRSNH